MGINAVDTHTLIGVQQTKKKFDPLFLSMFFPKVMTFSTKAIHLDKLADETVDMAAFVSPKVGGKVLHDKGGVVKAFEPAYVKPKHQVTSGHLFSRRAGEAIGGSLSPAERRLATIADLVQKEDDMITHREEWMAAQVVLTGSVTISGEGYPEQEVEFGRAAANSIVLAGAAKWDTVNIATYDPSTDIEAWTDNATGSIDVCIMGSGAWAKFRTFAVVKEKLETRRGSTSEIETAVKDLGKVVSFKGYFGDLAILVYKGQYVHPDTGAQTPFMPANKILFANMMNAGTRAYGAIEDAELNANGLFEGERAPKNWIQTGDPSGEFVMTQSAPLMVPDQCDANAFVDVTVY